MGADRVKMKPGWKTFVPGKLYRVDEFIDQSWGPNHQRIRALPPDTLFRYSRDPESGIGYFDQVVEHVNGLVSSEAAQKAIDELRERGMTYRQIARMSRRFDRGRASLCAAASGLIRMSTQAALLQVATSANGQH